MGTATLGRETRPHYTGPVVSTIEFIGPDEARQMLQKNTHNRPPREAIINTLVGILKRGNFELNGETVKFTASGRLADGQHRLNAIERAGVGAWVLVVRGLDENVHETVDFTLKRTFADTLFLRGAESSALLAGAVTLAWCLDTTGTPAPSTNTRPSPDVLSDYLADHPEIHTSVPFGVAAQKSEVRYQSSGAAGLHYLMARLNKALADEFWNDVITGIRGEEAQQAFVLRNTLVRDLGGHRHMSRTMRLAITIKAWNALREEREIKFLKWISPRGRSQDREPFPTIK